MESLFSFTKFCSLNVYFLVLKFSTYNQHTTYIFSVEAGKVLSGIAEGTTIYWDTFLYTAIKREDERIHSG
jgi:hypothetical protein